MFDWIKARLRRNRVTEGCEGVTIKSDKPLQARKCGSCGKIWAVDLLRSVVVDDSVDRSGDDPGEVRNVSICPGCLNEMGFVVEEADG
ncbi:MAG: hypothetical protein GY716_10255 [bacterium]|nr:hypothetical protein [bacterium]